MVSFICDNCQDTVKKPKLVAHTRRCGSYGFSCVDCQCSWASDDPALHAHTSCVSEAQKYQGALYRGDKKKNKNKNKNKRARQPEAELQPEPVQKRAKKEAEKRTRLEKLVLAALGDKKRRKQKSVLKAARKALCEDSITLNELLEGALEALVAQGALKKDGKKLQKL